MKTIRIYLASMSEDDVVNKLVELYISQKNRDYKTRLFLELSTWKDFVSVMTEEYNLEKYRQYIPSCDVAVFLFHSKLGQFTNEEFYSAHHAFLNSNRKIKKPMIYIYFKTDDHETVEISNLRNYIDSLEHFYDTYHSMDDLFVKLDKCIDKLIYSGVSIGSSIGKSIFGVDGLIAGVSIGALSGFFTGCSVGAISGSRVASILEKDTINNSVNISLHAPSTIRRGDDMFIQVFLHFPQDLIKAIQMAIENDPNASKLGETTIRGKIEVGQIIEFCLSIPDTEIDEPIQQIVWEKEMTSVQFAVSINNERKLGNLIGKLLININGIPVGKMKFITIVTENERSYEPAKTEMTFFRNYFISYANEDFEKVAARVQMIQVIDKIKGENLFLDKLFLQPGEKYENVIYDYIDNKADVFMLFWSPNAKESEWVRKEYMRAIEKQIEKGQPDICPVIIFTPVPDPPKELAHIHFGDHLISLTKS